MMDQNTRLLIALIWLCSYAHPGWSQVEPAILPGTKPLDWEGDISSRLIDSCDAFLLREIEKSVSQRDRHWVPGYSTHTRP
jgi:hypothetical protein